jgi:alpha-ribazole phosphatase
VIWTARHAPVAVDGVCYGRLDLPAATPAAEAAKTLEAGLAEAVGALGGAATVWSSPARRCREPADQLARALRLRHRESADLHELAFGAWEGRSWEDLEREDGEALARWMADWQGETPPGGESVAALESRVARWVGAVGEGTQLVVAHAGVVRALDVVLGGRSWPEAMALAVPHLRWQAAPRLPVTASG